MNPDHHFVGGYMANNRDRDDKDRVSHGEKQWCSKLTSEQVKEIRDRYAHGGISQAALGREYGVTQASVSYIVLRKGWKRT